MRCRLVHAIPGRARLRVESPEAFDRAATFQAYLEGQPGVRSVRLNPDCRSVTLTHDSAAIKVESLVALVTGLSPERLRKLTCPAPKPEPPQFEPLFGLPLALATAAAASALGGLTAMAPLLLAGAAVGRGRTAGEGGSAAQRVFACL